MKKSTLRLFILLTPFVAGLLLGFIVGNCSGRHYALRSETEGSASVAAETVSSEEETDEFMQPFELTKVLSEVLRDRRNAGKILVKYERKEHCFHITVR